MKGGKTCEACEKMNRGNAPECIFCGERFKFSGLYRSFRAVATAAIWLGGTLLFFLSLTVQ